jgi:hypothetical protein
MEPWDIAWYRSFRSGFGFRRSQARILSPRICRSMVSLDYPCSVPYLRHFPEPLRCQRSTFCIALPRPSVQTPVQRARRHFFRRKCLPPPPPVARLRGPSSGRAEPTPPLDPSAGGLCSFESSTQSSCAGPGLGPSQHSRRPPEAMSRTSCGPREPSVICLTFSARTPR